MVKFIRRSEMKEEVTYILFFQRKGDSRGSGYAFPCDEAGNPVFTSSTQQASYKYAMSTSGEFQSPVVEKRVNRWREPAVIECLSCKRHVEIPDFTNECECGQFYNSAGQQLTHPRNWGEETGERFDDRGNYIDGGDY